MNIVIEAQKRLIGNKSSVKQLRNEELIPAVIYCNGEDSLPITIKESSFSSEYRKSIGEIAFFVIKIDDKEIKTVIKEKQIHPVSRKVMHIDFQELVPGNHITFLAPLKFVGEPVGLKAGGKLEILIRKIKITCNPEDVPEEIKIDVSRLKVGQSILFSNLKLNNIQSSIPGNTVLAQVKGAKASALELSEEEEATEETQESAEEKSE